MRAQATAEGLQKVAQAMQANPNARDAVSLVIAEQYVKAFGELAQKGNTLLLPTNTGDVSGMVAQALAIFQVFLPSSWLIVFNVDHLCCCVQNISSAQQRRHSTPDSATSSSNDRGFGGEANNTSLSESSSLDKEHTTDHGMSSLRMPQQ